MVFSKSYQNWRDKRRSSKRLKRRASYTREIAQFLPAALELQETPVSAAPHVLTFGIMALVCVATCWAIIGKIDIVTTAQGKVVPIGNVKTVQVPERGVVSAIGVKNGQYVREGDVLLELDAHIVQADEREVLSEIVDASLQIARAKALLQALESNRVSHIERPAALPQELSSAPTANAQRLLEAQYLEYRLKLARLQSDVGQRQAEMERLMHTIRRLEMTLPLAQQREDDYKNLVEKNFVSKHSYIDRSEARLAQEGELLSQRSRINEVRSAIEGAKLEMSSLTMELKRGSLDAISAAEQRLTILEQARTRTKMKRSRTLIAAPVSGTVQQMAVHTIGAVLTEAQALCVIVPDTKAVEIEATLENKDIGFVHSGQNATIKVEAFQYTKYGTLPAKVRTISQDAIGDEKHGLVYWVRVTLDRTKLDVDGAKRDLTPGMRVSVEIKTGERRIIEFLLSPLLQHGSESLKER